MQPYFNIKAIRKARGMTQEQVGILAGMSKSQVSRMEKGGLSLIHNCSWPSMN